MKRNLTIVIDSGETRCASEPGKFCPKVMVTHMGTRWVCSAFGNAPIKEDAEGWLARIPACLAAEAK